jgi:hypothetical protein
VRHRGGDPFELEVEVLERLAEVPVVVLTVGHDPAVATPGVEHRAVVDHQPVGVEERPVARLTERQPEGVVAEHPLRRSEGVRPAKVPLVER